MEKSLSAATKGNVIIDATREKNLTNVNTAADVLHD